MSKDDRYIGILLEEIRDQNKALLEGHIAILQTLDSCARQADLDEVKQDIKVIKAAVTDLSRQVQDHERQLTQLKAA